MPGTGASAPLPPVLVVMGVSGCGKTTIAALLAARKGWNFREGDDLHPKANIEKMSHGIPLDDADRMPWLHAIAAVIDRWRACQQAGVVTCSALKRSYRNIIIGGRPGVFLVYLKGSRALIGRRMAARHEHFMPTALLDSQFATLEEPGADEHPIVIGVGPSPQRIAGRIVRVIAARHAAAARRLPGDAGQIVRGDVRNEEP